MKNFSLKNIALVLAVLFGTAAAYSASASHHGGRDIVDHLISGKAGKAPRMATPSFDCDEPSRPQHFAAPRACVEEQECFVPNECAWKMVIADGRAKYTSGPALTVIISECGKVEVDGLGCISRQMNKEIVQAVNLGKILFAVNCKLSAHFLRDLLATYEECPCPDRKDTKKGCK